MLTLKSWRPDWIPSIGGKKARPIPIKINGSSVREHGLKDKILVLWETLSHDAKGEGNQEREKIFHVLLWPPHTCAQIGMYVHASLTCIKHIPHNTQRACWCFAYMEELPRVCRACRGLKTAADSLELVWQTISCHVGAWNKTRVLRDSKCSEVLGPLSYEGLSEETCLIPSLQTSQRGARMAHGISSRP